MILQSFRFLLFLTAAFSVQSALSLTLQSVEILKPLHRREHTEMLYITEKHLHFSCQIEAAEVKL